MALEINSSFNVSGTPLSSASAGRGEARDTDRNLQKARAEKQQAIQRRQDAQAEMTRAEKHLLEASQREQAAAEQVLAAQAEQQQAQRSKALPARGELINITV